MRTHRRPKKRAPPPVPWWQAVWNLARRAYEEFNRDNGPLMAASISFYLLLSLVPMLLVAVAFAGYVFHSSSAGMRYVVDFTARLLPTATDLVRDLLAEVVRARGTLGGIGLLSLVWASMQGMTTLDTAINITWGTPPRNWLSGRLFSLAMLLVVGALFVTTVGITSFQTALSEMSYFGWLSESWTVAISSSLVSLLVSSVMFAVIYRYFPTRGSNWRVALQAGLMVAVAWEVIKVGYTWYMANFADYKSVYGPLGGMVGLVIWVYYSSFLLVLGSEIAWLRCHPDGPKPPEGRTFGRRRVPETETASAVRKK